MLIERYLNEHEESVIYSLTPCHDGLRHLYNWSDVVIRGLINPSMMPMRLCPLLQQASKHTTCPAGHWSTQDEFVARLVEDQR
jgi:hypothetical protein